MLPSLTIGLVQLATYANKEIRIQRCREHIGELVESEASIICLPEFINIPGPTPNNGILSIYSWAETLEDPTIHLMRTLASERDSTIIAPIYEKEDNHYYNSAVIIDPQGRVQGTYRKTSLGTPEQSYYLPGNNGFAVFDSNTGWRFGVLICYDRHFPEAVRVLALKGADIVFIPTATARGVWTDKIWEDELRYHAFNNRLYIAAVNRVGWDPGFGKEREYFGRSLVVDPQGRIMAQASSTRCETLRCELKREIIEEARNTNNLIAYRRPNIYQSLTQS